MCRMRAMHGLDWSGQRITGRFLPSTFGITPVRTDFTAHNRSMIGAHPPNFSTVLAELQHASTAGHCMGFAPNTNPKRERVAFFLTLHRIPTRSVSEGPSFLPQANCLLHPKVTLRVSVLAVDPDRRGHTESWLPDPPNR